MDKEAFVRFRLQRAAERAPSRPGRGDEAIEIPRSRELELVIQALGNPNTVDRVEDAYFDRIYPSWARAPSKMHWTPVQVARRAARLLTEGIADARVLDIGSGVGKFCLVGALTTDAVFHGIEQRPHFVALSRELLRHYQVERLEYFVGDMRTMDWTHYTGIYLFNPFQENKTPWFRIDSTLEPRQALFDEYVSAAEDELSRMPPGTRVVTYHGFGGEMPESYRRTVEEYCVRGPLELWIKKPSS